jgi:hypothetical protein
MVRARVERSEAAGGWLAAAWRRSLDGFSGPVLAVQPRTPSRVALDGSSSLHKG